MDPSDSNTRQPTDESNQAGSSRRRKHVPNLPILPRVQVKLEPIALEEVDASSKKKSSGKKNKNSKKLNPNLKVMTTKGLFSEGFQSELATNAKPESSQSKSTKRTTRSTTKDDELTLAKPNITLIEEPKELANIIKEYGEYFPVALPLTTKLNSIIHENEENTEDDKSAIKIDSDFKGPSVSEPKHSRCFSLLMDNSASEQTPKKDNYFLFQMPASYSAIPNQDAEVLVQAKDSEDEFDFDGNNIENSYFTSGDNSLDSGDSLNGCLELTESGKVRLRIGDEVYAVDDAMKNCFLQELYVAEADPSIDEDPIISKVGRISNKFICTWNLEDDQEQ